MNNTLPLCKCGCGLQVERITKKYYADHYRYPVGPPKKSKSNSNKSHPKSIKKNKIITSSKHGKISKNNLQSAGFGVYTC